MSDDEDEEADTDAAGADADVEDDDDGFMSPSPLPPRTRTSSFVVPASLTIGNVATFSSPIDEEEDCVLPPAAFSALRQTSPSKPRARSRRSTLESWFPPLANFIDFKDDELSGWRGVVEIVNGLWALTSTILFSSFTYRTIIYIIMLCLSFRYYAFLASASGS
jgi:hypothetical protein